MGSEAYMHANVGIQPTFVDTASCKMVKAEDDDKGGNRIIVPIFCIPHASSVTLATVPVPLIQRCERHGRRIWDGPMPELITRIWYLNNTMIPAICVMPRIN